METSVVMATFNGAEFILKQLESIRMQTVPVDEVLIRDDGSKDDTENIVNDFIDKYGLNNWKFTKNKKNLGWRENFSQLLNEAKGDLIFLSDQDDIWENFKVEKMTNIMKANKKIDILVSDYDQKLNKDRDDLSKNSIAETKVKDDVYKANQKWQNYKILRPGWTYVVRSKFVREYYNALKEGLANKGHDALLWRAALSKGSLYHYKQITGTWRMHESSAISSENKERIKNKEVLDYLVSEIEVLNRLIKLTKTPEYKRELQMKLGEYKAREKFLSSKNIFLGVIYIFKYDSLKRFVGDMLRVLNWKE